MSQYLAKSSSGYNFTLFQNVDKLGELQFRNWNWLDAQLILSGYNVYQLEPEGF